jgi:hypothetical protein
VNWKCCFNVVERGAASEMVKWKTVVEVVEVFFNTAVLASKLILAWK